MLIPSKNRLTASATLDAKNQSPGMNVAQALDLAFRIEHEAKIVESALWQVIHLFQRTDPDETSPEHHLSGADFIDAISDLFEANDLDPREVAQSYPFGDALPSTPLVGELHAFELEVHTTGGSVVSIIHASSEENCGDIEADVTKAPFILVQRNRRNSPPLWVTAHETLEKAGDYVETQEYGQDWETETLFDRRSGEDYEVRTGVTFVKASA